MNSRWERVPVAQLPWLPGARAESQVEGAPRSAGALRVSSLLLRGRAHGVVHAGHLLLHLHLQLLLLGLGRHHGRLLGDGHLALLLGHVKLHRLLLVLLLERHLRLSELLLELSRRHGDVAVALRLEICTWASYWCLSMLP